MLSIIVCIKQVLDPEAPVSSFQIDPGAKRAIPPKGVPPVLNPFDENALEAALRIKDTQEAKITVITMGAHLAKPISRKALASGADELILLEDDAFDNLDSYATAYILANAIKRIAEYDLILCGREAADTGAGQVGSGIAEILGIPSITVAKKVEVSDGKVGVERVVSDGYEVIEASMPALVTTASGIGDLRMPTLKAIMAVQKKTVTSWNTQELGVVPPRKRANLLKIFIPIHEGVCEIIAGESPEKAAENLALKLKEEGILRV